MGYSKCYHSLGRDSPAGSEGKISSYAVSALSQGPFLLPETSELFTWTDSARHFLSLPKLSQRLGDPREIAIRLSDFFLSDQQAGGSSPPPPAVEFFSSRTRDIVAVSPKIQQSAFLCTAAQFGNHPERSGTDADTLQVSLSLRLPRARDVFTWSDHAL